MKVAIHQPNYLPYIGYFQKMSKSDIFILLDIVQFSKDSFTQRTKIRTKTGWMWITIPIERAYYFKQINEIPLPQNDVWKKRHMKAIMANYSKCPYYDDTFIQKYYLKKKFEKLHEFNEYGIYYLKEKFGIETEIIRASSLDVDAKLKSSALLAELVKSVGGTVYISGTGAKSYLDVTEFEKRNIDVEFFEFVPFVYPQRWSGFESYMSAVDLWFNLGKDSTKYFK